MRLFTVVVGLLVLPGVVPASGRVGAGRQPFAAQRTSAPPIIPVNFGPVRGLTASALTRIVSLRSKPDVSAPVVATIEDWNFEPIEVLGTTRDAVQVRHKGKEGWASVREVVLDGSALVVDSATGAVVSRLAAPAGSPVIAFSPDGSRAVVYNRYAFDATSGAYEVRTSDWTIARGISLPKTAPEEPGQAVAAVFYRPSDGELYAAVYVTDKNNVNHLSVVKVGEEGAAAGPALWSGTASSFAASPDGRLGFVVMDRPANAPDTAPHSVAVVDLATMKTRNTMRVTPPLQVYGTDLVLNESGSELFLTTETSVVVLDTATGKRVRELQPGFAPGESPTVTQSAAAGDALLVTTYGSETTGPRSVWIAAGKPTPAPRDVAFLARAGTTVVATDAIGDRIFRLDGQRGVASTLAIERPELVAGWRAQWQPVTVSGLAASPDGKFLILLTVVPQEH